MTEKTHRVHLGQIGSAAFEAKAESEGTLIVDGSADIGGEGRGMRPMDLLLASVASCSAMDVLHILRQQRQPIEQLKVDIEGVRADAIPSPFVRIHLRVVARGAIDDHKLQRAVGLAVDKYCSARATLAADVTVTWDARIEATDAAPLPS
jgi:putative redox protein